MINMKNWFSNFFAGRQGMDELSKALFWSGLGLFAFAVALAMLGVIGLAGLIQWIAIFAVIYAFVRAFSRNLMQRESENHAYLNLQAKQRAKLDAAKARRRQSKDYKFYKCPGCHTWLRVPKGKGKIHIKCKCGYMLYRKT